MNNEQRFSVALSIHRDKLAMANLCLDHLIRGEIFQQMSVNGIARDMAATSSLAERLESATKDYQRLVSTWRAIVSDIERFTPTLVCECKHGCPRCMQRGWIPRWEVDLKESKSRETQAVSASRH